MPYRTAAAVARAKPTIGDLIEIEHRALALADDCRAEIANCNAPACDREYHACKVCQSNQEGIQVAEDVRYLLDLVERLAP